MNPTPLVTIIVPVYNAQSTIINCLQSLYQQSYTDIELIFVDDCCTDKSPMIIQEFIDEQKSKSKISGVIIRHDINKGVAAARNTGLDHAQGEYIYYVDSDDWIEPNTIELLVSTAVKSDLDIVGIEWYLSYASNERYMKQYDITSPLDAFSKMASGVMRWNLWLFMVRKSLYIENNIHFISGQNMGEDMMVMGKLLLCAQSVEIIHEPLYHYIQTNDNSLTKDVSEKHLSQVIANTKELENFAHEKLGVEVDLLLHFLKLNIKLPLLITNNKTSHKSWLQLYTESHPYIMKNNLLPLRTKLLQWCGAHHLLWVVSLYYNLVFKFVYGKLYR